MNQMRFDVNPNDPHKQDSSFRKVDIDLAKACCGLETHILSPEWRLEEIRAKFTDLFIGEGYQQEPAALISSGIDPTVLFVGSNVSTLKKFILNTVPDEGVVVDQPSMRFRELSKLFDPAYRPFYGAFFNEVGAITPGADPEGFASALHTYLTDSLGLKEEDIIIRVSSMDDDLVGIARTAFSNLEKDSRPEKYYRHTIGEAGFAGRNFNIALRNCLTGEYQDIGNYLAFERDGKPSFLEIALGDTVIKRSLDGLMHVLDCYEIDVPAGLNHIESLNFKNAIIVLSVLYREGLRASNRNNQERIVLKYLRYVQGLSETGAIGAEELIAGVASFEKSYYGESSAIGNQILFDMERRKLSSQKDC